MTDTFDVWLIVRYGNVPRNSIGKEIPLLHHRTALTAPPTEIVFIQIGIAYLDVSILWLIETQKEFYERGLSASTRSHDCRYLAVGNREIDVGENIFRTVDVVFKG